MILILYISLTDSKQSLLVLKQELDYKCIAKLCQFRERFIRIGPYQSQKPVIVKTSSARPIRVV